MDVVLVGVVVNGMENHSLDALTDAGLTSAVVPFGGSPRSTAWSVTCCGSRPIPRFRPASRSA